jgi:hypothetical protein
MSSSADDMIQWLSLSVIESLLCIEAAGIRNVRDYSPSQYCIGIYVI